MIPLQNLKPSDPLGNPGNNTVILQVTYSWFSKFDCKLHFIQKQVTAIFFYKPQCSTVLDKNLMFEKMFMSMSPLILAFRNRSCYPHPTPDPAKKIWITVSLVGLGRISLVTSFVVVAKLPVKLPVKWHFVNGFSLIILKGPWITAFLERKSKKVSFVRKRNWSLKLFLPRILFRVLSEILRKFKLQNFASYFQIRITGNCLASIRNLKADRRVEMVCLSQNTLLLRLCIEVHLVISTPCASFSC